MAGERVVWKLEGVTLVAGRGDDAVAVVRGGAGVGGRGEVLPLLAPVKAGVATGEGPPSSPAGDRDPEVPPSTRSWKDPLPLPMQVSSWRDEEGGR